MFIEITALSRRYEEINGVETVNYEDPYQVLLNINNIAYVEEEYDEDDELIGCFVRTTEGTRFFTETSKREFSELLRVNGLLTSFPARV